MNLSNNSKILLNDLNLELENSGDTLDLEFNINIIKNYENSIIASSSIEAYKKEIILTSISVLRHSLYYWFNDNYSNQNLVWSLDCDDESNSQRKKRKKKKWKNVIGCGIKDCIGGMLGYYYFKAPGAVALGALYSASHALGGK